MTHWFRRIFIASLSLMIVACQGQESARPAYQGTDISSMQLGSDFTLTDHHGKKRRLSEFHGKAVVLFFGYIHCPDVCPTTLAELASTMKKLGSDADRVQVLFVSVDPERDSAEQMAAYVTAFDPRFIGLSGSTSDITNVARAYKIVHEKRGDIASGNYTIDHSAASFLFDPQGKLQVMIPYGGGSDMFVHDLKIVLSRH